MSTAMPWSAAWLTPIISQLTPRLQDLDELCSAPPPAPPSIDLEQLAISGELWKVPNLLLEWAWAWWQAEQWNTFCECIPVLGPGTCPPVPETDFNFTYTPASTWKVVADIPIKGGFDTLACTWKNKTFDIYLRFSFDFLDADKNLVAGIPTREYWQTIGPGSSLGFGITWWASRNTDNVRYWRQWVFGDYVRTGTISVQLGSWTGTCLDVESPATPYVPPSGSADPGIPAPPALPTGCDLDDLCGRVDALQKAVAIVSRDVTLIQRQAVPFAYISGASRTRTGAGSFSVSAILGLRIDITTSPSWLGGYPGTPETKFEYGWLSFGTSDGWQRTIPIRHDPQLVFGVSGAVTTIGYTLAEGVTATFTDLIREP